MSGYGPEVHNFVKKHVAGTPMVVLAEMTNKKCGTNFTYSSMKSFCANHKYRNGRPGYVRRDQWLLNEEQEKYLRRYVKGRHFDKLTEMINKKFGTEFTVNQIRGFCSNHHITNGCDMRFQKGLTSPNKGKKQTDFMSPEAIEKTKATRFQKGQTVHNHREVGSSRVTRDGYIEIKVAEPNVWKSKHHIVWEEHNGPIPKDHIVRFLDGNPSNCDIDNLILVTNDEHLMITRQGLFTENQEVSRTGAAIAKLECATRKRAKERRETVL